MCSIHVIFSVEILYVKVSGMAEEESVILSKMSIGLSGKVSPIILDWFLIDLKCVYPGCNDSLQSLLATVIF